MIKKIPRKQKRDERGTLFVLEDATLPFPIRRVYTTSGVSDSSVERGAHAHYATEQALFVIAGAMTFGADDGKAQESVRLTSEDDGVLLEPMVWHTLKEFTPDCVVLVAASAPYDEADYIRNYEDFKNYAGTV